MTDSVRIPELHLFGSRRQHHSPTRDYIDYQDYRTLTRDSKVATLSPERYLSAGSACGTGSRAWQQGVFVRAPSTYIQCAEQYLLGNGLPLFSSPLETGRFVAPRGIDAQRRSPLHVSRNCDCQSEYAHQQHERGLGVNISKQAYLTNKIKVVPPTKPSPRRNDPKVVPQPQPQPKSEDQSPKRDPYIQISSQRDNRNVGLAAIPENSSLIVNEIIRGGRSVGTEGTQTEGQKKQPGHEQINSNRSSVIMERFMRAIPTTLDAHSFKKIINKRFEEFYNIKINFDELPAIDLDDLIETKDQYIDFSKQILQKLNYLAGDRVEMSLISRFLTKKEPMEVYWPNV